MPTTHIESEIGEIASVVLMPGDPNRAKYIAENYLKNVKIVNKVRGMTAYTGEYDGKKITIFPSGMGIPSIGIYSYELFKHYKVENFTELLCGNKDLDKLFEQYDCDKDGKLSLQEFSPFLTQLYLAMYDKDLMGFMPL